MPNTNPLPVRPIWHNIAQAVEDPQILHRNMMVKHHYPGGDMDLFGSPVKLSETPTDPSGLAPKVGQHNDEIYCDVFGFEKERIEELKKKGIV